MHVDEIGPPVRTRLGFHIIQLTDSKPVRQMVFEEVRQEVGLTLENEKRRKGIAEFGRGPGKARRVRALGTLARRVKFRELLHCLPVNLTSV